MRLTTELDDRVENNNDGFSRFVKDVFTAREDNKDIVVPANSPDFFFSPESGLVVKNGTTQGFIPTSHCHGQIASRLNIPRKYYDKMLQESPELLAQNINHWFDSDGKKFLLRTNGDTARALMSDRYRPLDNHEVLSAISPVIREISSPLALSVSQSAMTEKKMYLRFVSDKLTGAVKVGQTVRFGFMLGNSEVGGSSLFLNVFTETLECTNGMVGERILQQNHIGGSVFKGDIQDFLKDETRQAKDKATLMELSDVLSGVLTQEYFDNHLAKLQSTTKNFIVGDKVIDGLKVLSNKFRISDPEQERVLGHFIESGDLSQWGLSSAVTRSAQDSKSYDRRVELETVGSQIIDLPLREWSIIANAS